MDDTPLGFFQELRDTVLRRGIGRIALALLLALATLQFLNTVVWYVTRQVIGFLIAGHSESVLFRDQRPFDWISIAIPLVQFVTAIVAVFYLNRWLFRKKNEVEVSESSEADPALNVDLGSLANRAPRDRE